MNKLEQLRSALQPLQASHVECVDESHQHSRGLETHFKATIVSDVFVGLHAVKRHQRVYALLSEIMPQIHALALHTYTKAEWEKVAQVPNSPQCRGGSH